MKATGLLLIIGPVLLAEAAGAPRIADGHGYQAAGAPAFLAGNLTDATEASSEGSVQESHPRPPRGESLQDAAAASTDERRWYAFDKFGGVVYSSGEGYRLTLDVYVPPTPGPHPAVLVVHGGAWRMGSKLFWMRHAWKLVNSGFVVVAINYRHAPEFPFPAQVHDCKAALQWMADHADAYQIDTDRVAAIGYSAGAHLVAMTAFTDDSDDFDGTEQGSEDDRREGDAKGAEAGLKTRSADNPDQSRLQLQAIALGGAPCDLTFIDARSPSLNYWLGASRAEDPEIWRQATPSTWLSADDPPCHFFHGRQDAVVPMSASRKLYDQMKALGIRVEYREYDHGHFGLFSNVDALDPVIAFFCQEMGLPNPTSEDSNEGVEAGAGQ